MGAFTVILFLFLISTPVTRGIISSFFPSNSIQGICKGTCETSPVPSGMTNKTALLSSEGGSDLFCDKNCSQVQCKKGCSLYQDAVKTGCQKVCASSFSQDVNVTGHRSPSQDEMRNCIQGCIFALDEYAGMVKSQLSVLDIPGASGLLDKPDLVRSSLRYSSLTLKWHTPILENVTYKVHKKLVDVDSGWHLHADTRFRQDGRIELSKLRPYVTYKFKVLAILSSLPEHILESQETVQITTKAHGAPTTAPQITSLTTPSPRVISLTWRPPVFTNGQLLSYRIYVQAVDHPVVKPTTLEVQWNASSWLLSQLLSSQRYVISLSAWNAEGEGPKTSRTISTPNPGNLSAHETPYLILGTGNQIVKRNILDVIQYATEYSDELYSNPDPNEYIRDIGLHVSRRLVLATDKSGRVTVISLADKQVRQNHYPSILDPTAISVDWLADRVFIASRDRIYSCPLERDLCVVVVNGLGKAASDVRVDPINGFLYYVINGEGQGLYRIDLGDISHKWTSSSTSLPSSATNTPKAELIVAMSDLRTHVIDFDNVHLYLVNSSARTMQAAFLDGSNMRPFHEDTVNSAFSDVSSIAFYNQTFIWTNGSKMYVEEYESHYKKYMHNELLFFTPPYMGLNVYHPSAQPTPVPSSAPDKVEALFTHKLAYIRWKPPPRLQYQGFGAWNNWTYELQLALSHDGHSVVGDVQEYSIADLSLSVSGLKADSIYVIKVRARSEAGFGPWSENFVGRTLKKDGLSILMAVAGGSIVQRNISEDSHTTVVNFFSDAMDLAWYEDLVMWVTQDGTLSLYNRTSHLRRQLVAAEGAYCLAYDWLGHKVYWSEPSQGVIRRSDVQGLGVEYIRQTSARDMVIDSVAGRLYWATQHSVDTCWLNGDDHRQLFSLPYFSGRFVISLTLDLDAGKVLWYVKGYDTQSVYAADLSPPRPGQSPTFEHLGDFSSISSTSGLQYFSQRLFWLTQQRSLVVGDLSCNYTSAVSFYSNVTSFSVVHPALHNYPAEMNKEDVHVIPNPIRSKDIRTEGNFSNFNLTWPRSSEVTHGTVFYKVFVVVGSNNKHFTTANQWNEIDGLSPYTLLEVSIQPYTYWGYAEPTTVSVRSPMSIPTAPLSPEVYVNHHKNASTSQQSLAADFHWMSPQHTNGIISYHLVTYWMGDGPAGERTTVRVKGTGQHYILSPLVKSQTYHFKVVACTMAGCGPESVTKTIVTDAVSPKPTLLVATAKGVSLTEMDARLNSTVLLNNVAPEAVTFLAQDLPRMFWVDIRNKLIEYSSGEKRELVDLKGNGRDVTIDWISRTLYTVENASPNRSNVMQFNMDHGGYSLLVSRPEHIGSVIADPYNSAILWTERSATTGQGQIMSADTSTGKVEVVLGAGSSRVRRSSSSSSCSCSSALDVAPVIAMSYKRPDGATEIVFADKISGSIYTSDISGCHCSLVFEPTARMRYGLPPDLLAVDHKRVTWYNTTEGRLYSISKSSGQGLIVQDLPGVQDILAYGSHLQPLPDSGCLDPGAYNSTVETVSINTTAIHLRLSAPIRPAACGGISAPVDKYTVYYKKVEPHKAGASPQDCQSSVELCQIQEVYSTTVHLTKLEPYTKYLIQVAVSNYYTQYLSKAMSEPLIFTTKFGVPDKARDVIVTPLTPERIQVKWLPPHKFNGPPEHVSYVVQFSTVTSEGHVQRETENVTLMAMDIHKGWMQTMLSGLEPDHLYTIKIQTCTANRSMCSSTGPIQTRTFMTPSAISFVDTTPHSIEISWRSPADNGILVHFVNYAEVKPGELEWQQKENIPETTLNFTEYEELIDDLKPNTLYAFRIKANYRNQPYQSSLFIWPGPDRQMFTHRTLVFHPDQPLAPTVAQLKNGAYEVRWEEPEDNGAPINYYILEYKNIEIGKWLTAYNGSVERWLVETSRLERGKSYVFRVSAANSQGMGSFSVNSSVFLASYVFRGIMELSAEVHGH
ncbi:proto-oncogene tyrosine-protein kinase ROS [Aplysia californica]|uniref:Proto-oncogene tyrosine-protein kinase ROS n=1 Tax=Aplysia californica TaxID=6500 RepID=A0ABM1W1R1_APLCA|nr:proto-oncogene tyrosine-protein kinase ROS [Aplysia californica]